MAAHVVNLWHRIGGASSRPGRSKRVRWFRIILVAVLSLLAGVGSLDSLTTPATPAHAQTGTLLKVLNIPAEAQNCPGGNETSVSVIAGRMAGITDKPVLLGVSCLANTVPTDTTPLRTIYYLDAGTTVPSTTPTSTTIVKTIVTPSANVPSTFLGWGAIATRIDKGDVAACSNTSDNKHAVYKIDISPFTSTTDGTASKLFDLPAGTAACDGLAWDPGDNSFYQSFENSATITHTKILNESISPPTTLALQGLTLPIIPTGFQGGGSQCQASGLATAGPSLFVACGSSTTMIQITTQVTQAFPTAGVIGANTIATGHQLQDAECDPAWTGMDAIWSKDKVNNQLFAFGVPNFTCGFRTGDPSTAPAPAQCPANSVTMDIALDSDGDGLPDCWEIAGIDYDGDPNHTADYQLPWNETGATTAPQKWLGARPDPKHKDLYLELDFMDPLNADQMGAIDDVIAAFAAAPATITKSDGTSGSMNPDSTAGIRLHIQVDDQIMPPPVSPVSTMLNLAFEPCTAPLSDASSTVDFDALKSMYFGTLGERTTGAKAVNAKRFAFRYGIIGRQLLGKGSTSGCSELFGNDFVITPALWPNGGARGMLNGTLMHEFGHTLGLRHGGVDNTNCKPNYLSVMSYSRQVDGQPIPRNGKLPDYSRQKLPTLNETALDEPPGVGGPATDQTAYGVPGKPSPKVFVIAANQPWNLNSDTNVTDLHLGSPSDPNNLGSTDCNGTNVDPTGVPSTYLVGFDDWSNIASPPNPTNPSMGLNFLNSFEFEDGLAASPCRSDNSGFTTCGRDRLTDSRYVETTNPTWKTLEDLRNEVKTELDKVQADAIAANAAPLFTITMTDSPDPVKQGQQLTYTVTVQNQGPKPGTNVTVTDTLPPSTGGASADFVSAKSSSGTCTQASGVVTCNLGSLAVGSSATVTIVVKPKGEGTLTNAAGVSSDPDPVLVQSQVSQTTTVTKGGP